MAVVGFPLGSMGRFLQAQCLNTRYIPQRMLQLTDIAVILRESTVECLNRYHKTGPISPVMKPCAWAENVVQTFSMIFAAMWFTTRSSWRENKNQDAWKSTTSQNKECHLVLKHMHAICSWPLGIVFWLWKPLTNHWQAGRTQFSIL